jgi:hypothetical protein
MEKTNMMLGYDFYFRVNGKGESHVRHVRLWGSSEKYLDSVRPQYKKEGFALSPATRDEYRAANWKPAGARSKA